LAAALPLLIGCGVDGVMTEAPRNAAAVLVQSDMESDLEGVAVSRETFALGSSLTSVGAVPISAASDTYLRGGEIFLSVNVAGASSTQLIEVKWLAPDGHVLRRDARDAGSGTKYVAFSSGQTDGWTPGPHRAVVLIDGRSVSEKAFALL